MAKRFVWLMVALLWGAHMPHAFAMSEGYFVTKATQAEQGLDYTLSAVRASDTAVLVSMEIQKVGKLKDLKRVTMTVGTGSPIVSADLQTRPGKNGSVVVSFQLSPELADKCSIMLFTPTVPVEPMNYEQFYAVELKSYVTDRK